MGREWDAQWFCDSVECGEPLKSNRVESTQRLRHGWVVGCRAYELKWGDIRRRGECI